MIGVFDMDNELKNEAKATLQAGAVNVSTDDLSIEPTVNLNFNGSDQLGFPGRFIRGARKALNPAKLARQDAEAMQLEADAVAKAVASYRAAFPTFSDKQLYMLAHGYSMTPVQAENVLDVLDRAGKMSEHDEYGELPASCVDIDIQGAQGAYDEELRDIWSKLIAQEVMTGKARSKRTKAILESMDADDSKHLAGLLSYSLWAETGPQRLNTPIPVLVKTEVDNSWTYNGRAVSVDAIKILASLGILVSGEWITFTIQPKQRTSFTASFGDVIMYNNSDSKLDVELGKCRFLKPGIELAEAIGAPTSERILELVRESVKDKALCPTVELRMEG